MRPSGTVVAVRAAYRLDATVIDALVGDMICAECARCGRRSILSPRTAGAIDHAFEGAAAAEVPPEPVSLRCDLCGSRRVSVVHFAAPVEAIAFVAKRGSGR